MVSYFRQRQALLQARERRLRAGAERRDHDARVEQEVAAVLLAQEDLVGAEEDAIRARLALGAALVVLIADVGAAQAAVLSDLSVAQVRRLTRGVARAAETSGVEPG